MIKNIRILNNRLLIQHSFIRNRWRESFWRKL